MAFGAKHPQDRQPPDAARPPVEPSGPAAPPPEAARAGALSDLAGAALPGLMDEAGYRVPWRERLSTRLLGFLGAAVLAAIAALWLAETRIEAGLEAQVAAELGLVSRTTQLALHRAMLQDRRDDAYQIMEDVARQPDLAALRLTDGTGRVTFSTDRAEVGTVLDRAAPPCAGCHAAGAPRREVAEGALRRITTGRAGRVLSTAAPIANETTCATAACHAHPPDKAVLGVLEVGISLQRLDATITGFRWRSLVISAVVAALLGLAFWAFARRQVVQPVGALVAAARRVTREDLEAEVPQVFDGELGLLGATFNEMTRSLRHARGELRALLASLERKVAERTDALVAARDELVRTEKLASVGRLAAALAHELNNPISGIMTFARLIARTLEAGAPDDATRRTLLRNLRLVERESERCSEVIRNLLDFAHERPLIRDELDPNAVVEDALLLVGSQLTIQGTKVVRRLAPLPRLQGDFAQLRQACVNVLMNASEAMPFEGTLTVTTALLPGGAEVELAFEDTGPGIPADRVGNVFDPFFSTKERGTGLGLSVVHGILTGHGGAVDLTSAPGRGTRVALRLPVRPREGGPAAA